MKAITKQEVHRLIRPRQADSHKGIYGHSLLIAGQQGKTGAALIAAQACLRSGTGLLSVSLPKTERFILQCALPEAMVVSREDKLNLEPYAAIGIGPGLGTQEGSRNLLRRVLQQAGCPLVLDADALNLIAQNRTLLAFVPEGSVLTPHPKEFDRLFGTHSSQEARIKTAIEKAKQHRLVIVLKGPHTVVTSGKASFSNTSGNAGLAKGGSGDALTGMITAFLAQGLKPLEASLCAVFLHGLAADLTLEEQSMESMLITDVIRNIGKAFLSIRKR